MCYIHLSYFIGSFAISEAMFWNRLCFLIFRAHIYIFSYLDISWIFQLSEVKIFNYQWFGSPKELNRLRISLEKSSYPCPGKWIVWLCHNCDGSRPPKQSRQIWMILWSHYCLTFLCSIPHPFISFIPPFALSYYRENQNIPCVGQIRLSSFQKDRRNSTSSPSFHSCPSSHVHYIWRKFSTCHHHYSLVADFVSRLVPQWLNRVLQ